MPERVDSDEKHVIAYIVKAWPRLSETFILNEIISLERRSVPIRIFSVKEPDAGPAHAKVAQVRAEVTYLALWQHWKKALPGNLRSFRRRPGRYVRVLLEAAASVIRYRRFAALRHFLKAGYLADILFRNPVASLHAHFASTPTLVAMFTHQLSGIPYTFTAHAKDIYVNDPEVFRIKLERARAVVTCTDYNRRFLLKQYGSSCDGKLHCIYHGIDVSQFKFKLSGRVGSGEPVILSVGRLVEKKGLGDLIAAAEILRRRGRTFQVEIIGTGPLRGTLEAQSKRLGLADRVKLLGAQAHEMVCLAYQRAAVFVLPCVIASNGDRDGIPNVLIEAMASGVPVVTTPVSGIPELVEGGRDGLLVPAGNPRRLADALESILSSLELGERLARAARTKVEAHFSIEASVWRLLALFENSRVHENPVSIE